MMNFTSLTNTKVAKELGTQVILSPTLGTVKVTPKACALLGVSNGEYVQLVQGGGANYAVVGKSGFGNKLASSNKTGSGTLALSSASAWKQMGGDENFNISFDVAAEPAFVQEDASFGEGERSYYLLTEVSRDAKQVRKPKASADAASTENAAASTEEVTAESPAIEEANPFELG